MEEKKIQNTKIAPDAVEKFLAANVEVKTYLPFKLAVETVRTVARANAHEEDGMIVIDQVEQYVGFVIAMILAHTDLECGDDPVEDYDALCKSGILSDIIAMFQDSYDTCSMLLNMVTGQMLEHNNVGFVLSRALNRAAEKFETVSDIMSVLNQYDIEEIVKKIMPAEGK